MGERAGEKKSGKSRLVAIVGDGERQTDRQKQIDRDTQRDRERQREEEEDGQTLKSFQVVCD